MKSKFFIAALALGFASIASAAVTVADMGTMTLRRGSTGTPVMKMQEALNACTGSTLVLDGKFGPATTGIVKSFQASKGLVQDGLVGPKTKAMFAECSMTPVTPGTTPTTPVVSGTEGILTSVNKLGSYNSTKVMEGDKDKVVFGFDAMARDSSQVVDGLVVAFQNTHVDGTPALSTSNKKFLQYASDVSVWLDGKEIGRKAATAYSDDANDVYVYRFTGMKGSIAAGAKGQILIAVSGNTSIDSTNATHEAWKVNVGTSVSGAANFVSAVSPNGRYRDYGSALAQSTMDFQKAGTTSSDQKFKVTTAASNPLAQTVQVSNTSDTNEVLLAAFDAKAENAAMKVQRVPVVLTATNGGADAVAPDVQAIVSSVTLYADGKAIETRSITTSGASATVTFGFDTRLQQLIASNSTVKFEVKAKINDIENTGVASTDLDNGDKIKASADSSTMTVELDNAMGDTVANKTGSLTGSDMTLRSEGVQVTMGVATSTATTNNLGEILSRTYTVPVSVKAFDSTVYLGQVAAEAATTTTAQSIAYQVEGSNGTALATTANATFTSTDAPVEGSAYRVDSGATRNFTLTVIVGGTTGQSQKQFRVQAEEIRTFVDAALTAGTSTAQTLTPANTYETGFFGINR